MPEENQPMQPTAAAEPVANAAEKLPEMPQPAATFGTMPNATEAFGRVRQVAERKENHTLTVREVARRFEEAGVARTERSIINWCQPNRQGISRLDCYYDPNERKYYITPQSVEMAIQEEIQRARKTDETKNTEPFGNGVTHVKHGREEAVQETEAKKIQELEREIMDLKIANRGKDQFIELMSHERKEIIEKLQATSRTVGQLETKIMQLRE